MKRRFVKEALWFFIRIDFDMVPQVFNMTIDSDPQRQEAASPRRVVVRSSLRYPA